MIIHLSTRFRLVVKPNGTKARSSLNSSCLLSTKAHNIVLKLNNIYTSRLFYFKVTNKNYASLFTTIFTKTRLQILGKTKAPRKSINLAER